MTIDFKQLPQLQPLFKLLSSGAHLNRLQDSELWVELENHQSQYETLFAALGFSLVLDGRGYAYFKTDQASAYTGIHWMMNNCYHFCPSAAVISAQT